MIKLLATFSDAAFCALATVRSCAQRLLAAHSLVRRGIREIFSLAARAVCPALQESPVCPALQESSKARAQAGSPRLVALKQLLPSVREVKLDAFDAVVDAALETKPGAQILRGVLTWIGPILKSTLARVSPVIVQISPMIVATGVLMALLYLLLPEESWLSTLIWLGILYALIQLRRIFIQRLLKVAIIFIVTSTMQLTPVTNLLIGLYSRLRSALVIFSIYTLPARLSPLRVRAGALLPLGACAGVAERAC